MPSITRRVPPSPPRPPAAPSNAEWQRYTLRLKAWFVGELLRALAAHAPSAEADAVPLDYPLPAMTANYASLGMPGASMVSDQMGSLLRYIDEEQRVFTPLATALREIAARRADIARILWRKHLWLQPIPVIARHEGLSERSVQYFLAVGNGSVFAAYCDLKGIDGRLRKMSGATHKTVRGLVALGERLAEHPEADAEELSLAGVDLG